MHIDSKLIKTERERRAWSQEQLAEVASIGLRTLQRVESTGTASFETAKALAAAFGCSLDELCAAKPRPNGFWRRPAFAGIVLACSILAIVLITTHVQAREIMLNVVLTSPLKGSSTFKMLTTNGKQTEARLEKESRLIFIPTLVDNNLILIAVDIYDYDGKDFKLVSQPKVMVRNGGDARIQVGTDDGKIYDLKINPQRI